MSLNPFHAKEVDESELRSTAEVFSSSSKALEGGIASRFASSGKYTTEQLEDGADLAVLEKGGLQMAPGRGGAGDDEPDPDDKRSLYERLKAQKDAKQEEFEHNAAFKNQMDHWKMDEDESAFEDARLLKLSQQENEARRLAEEGAQFYKLARAGQERTIEAPSLPAAAAASSGAALKRKAPAPKPTLKPMFKVLKAAPKDSSGASGATGSAAAEGAAQCAAAAAPAAPAPSSAPGAAPRAAPAGLPGMGAYDDSDDDDDE